MARRDGCVFVRVGQRLLARVREVRRRGSRLPRRNDGRRMNPRAILADALYWPRRFAALALDRLRRRIEREYREWGPRDE